MSDRPSAQAVVFDFDGLILDTEMPEFRSWSEEFARFGAELPLEEWLQIVGTYPPTFDPLAELRRLGGSTIDVEAVRARRRQRHHALIEEEEPRPGVLDRIAEAVDMGLRLGVASTSRRQWVTGHLERLGLLAHFDAIVGRDDVGGRAKPAPDVYLEVVRLLGCEPHTTVAIEDSANGLLSARAAGLATIAVPNRMTQHLDLSVADAVVGSLADHTLADLLRLAGLAAPDPPGQADTTSRSSSS
jgi:HAD superfamily hydrolase (TIGR01509 family)